jgi:predicted aspartyl protease
MIFPLFSLPAAGPGNRRIIKPFVPLLMIGPRGRFIQDSLIDTGSEEILIAQPIAARLGIDTSAAPTRSVRGVARQPTQVRMVPATLYMSDGVDVVRWNATIGVTLIALPYPLFGMAGGLEHFKTTLDPEQGTVTLLPLPSLPRVPDLVP